MVATPTLPSTFKTWARSLLAESASKRQTALAQIAAHRDAELAAYSPDESVATRAQRYRRLLIGDYALTAYPGNTVVSVLDAIATSPFHEHSVLEPGTRSVRLDIKDELKGIPHPLARVSLINGRLFRLGDAAVDVALNAVAQSPWGQRLLSELDEQDLALTAVFSGSSVEDAVRNRQSGLDAPFRMGVGAGLSLETRLAEVMPKTYALYGEAATPKHLRSVLTGGLITPGLMRLRGGPPSRAFERLATGCRSTCYSSDQGIVERRAPHGTSVKLFDGLEDFHRRHVQEGRFDPRRFRLVGSSITRSQLAPNFWLANAKDPLLIARGEISHIRVNKAVRETFDCPMTVAPLARNTSTLVADVYSCKELWLPLVDYSLSTATPLRPFESEPIRQAKRRLDLPNSHSPSLPD